MRWRCQSFPVPFRSFIRRVNVTHEHIQKQAKAFLAKVNKTISLQKCWSVRPCYFQKMTYWNICIASGTTSEFIHISLLKPINVIAYDRILLKFLYVKSLKKGNHFGVGVDDVLSVEDYLDVKDEFLRGFGFHVMGFGSFHDDAPIFRSNR